MPTDKTTLGFWLYIMSDCVLFASLFATFAVLRGSEDIFSLPFVFVQTLALLISSFTVGLAFVTKKQNTFLILTLLLGLGFLGLEVYEFKNLMLEGFGPSHSAYLSSFFALVGTHGLHVAAGCLWMLVMLVTQRFYQLQRLVLFWHFLDIIWIFIFTFVYLFGII